MALSLLTPLSIGYHFTVSGFPVEADACGENLTGALKSGTHASVLSVDFRSNRIDKPMDGEFVLVVLCTKPPGARRRKRESLLTDSVQLTNGTAPTEETLTSTEAGIHTYDCTPTLSFEQRVVRDYNDTTNSAEKYMVRLFTR